MPNVRKLTPNLLVADVSRSLAFYADVLGFSRGMHVPDEPPFVFASVTAGPVEIFFNDAAATVAEYPALAGRPIGASGTLFIEIDGIEAYYAQLADRVQIEVALKTQWYGMKEFAISDPDGYLITFAERVEPS
jgi:catechol 2,3-dioxygenase-like lactoylglutathione lyase family enzyme